jgi:AmiR/NasT family two-component response regulator
LNAYSRRAKAFTETDAEVVHLLCGHASVALAASKTKEDLRLALGTRTLIGQAEGVLMHAFDIDAEKAFAYMRRLSQDENVKLVKIAERIIENRDALRLPQV